MEIRNYYDLTKDEQIKILEQMDKTDWDAGKYLHWLLKENSFFNACGENSQALLLTENNELCAFCTLADMDEIDDDSMKPWIGFVYTFPNHRGKRYSGLLVEKAVEIAKENGCESIYVSSEEVGLYEKYGFSFLKDATSIHGYETQIFKKEI